MYLVMEVQREMRFCYALQEFTGSKQDLKPVASWLEGREALDLQQGQVQSFVLSPPSEGLRAPGSRTLHWPWKRVKSSLKLKIMA